MELNKTKPKGLDDALGVGAKIVVHEFPRPQQEKQRPLPLIRDLAEAAAFPIHALGSLAPVAEAIQKSVQAPPALCGQSLLAAANLAVQGHADVLVDGRPCPLSLFLVSIGESGERKSAVDRLALLPHRAFEKRLAFEQKGELDRFKTQKSMYDKRRDEAERIKDLNDAQNAIDGLGPEPEPPLSAVLIAEEPSYEGLVKLAAVGRPSLGLFTAEGGRLIGGYSMSVDQKLKTGAGLSGFWDGDPITRVRAGEGASVIYGRRLAMHIMAQPGVAFKLVTNPELIDQGLNSRLLVTYPRTTVGSRRYRAIDASTDPVITSYNDRILEILQTSLPLEEGTRNQLAPRPLTLSVEAKSIWVSAHDSIEEELRPERKYASIKGLGNKAAEHVLRIAGTLCLFEDLAANEIQAHHIESGICLIEHYLEESLRIHNAAIVDPDLELAAKVLAWAHERGGKFHLAQLYRLGPASVRSKASAEKIIEILEEHFQIFRMADGWKLDGVHHRDAWEVNREPV